MLRLGSAMLIGGAATADALSVGARGSGGAPPPIDMPYGSWPSPITASLITGSTVRLGPLACDTNGRLFWAEGRPQENGRNVIVRWLDGEPNDHASERGALDCTPADVNVRTRVHEYGGGAWALGPATSGGGLIYSDFSSQRLYWLKDADATPLCLTPDPAWTAAQFRFADGFVVTKGSHASRFVCVREDHTKGAPKDVVNEVVSISLDGTGDIQVIATGRDFYSHPRVSADGKYLAYVTWNHPSMPWDSTELRVVELGGVRVCSDLHKTLETCYMHTFWTPPTPAPTPNPQP